ncbi:MAG: potassium uptake protein, partial [Gemmatimonadaceae bacterium]|nr:potassium uptake protein [Gemmatimonadaceae bacterium]
MTDEHEHHHAPESPTGQRLAVLTLTALGVVYGDIGTSPLYALKECFNGPHGVPATAANVVGVLSLIVWSLILVVSVKYISFIMRADNRGEGGILALLALLLQKGGGISWEQREEKEMDDEERARRLRLKNLVIVLGLFGAALLYGDGIITPAISVLGAVEGVSVIAPALTQAVVPVTIAILVGVFAAQRFGTDRVGKAFGPIMLTWFISIAALGIPHILERPAVLAALLPTHAVAFMAEHGTHGFVILGAVVLSVTGAEALYADMGHFGRRPIRLAWFALVFPCLLLNYFGQGAMLIGDPAAATNPFYLVAPRMLLYPLLGLATLAAIVASQALISGAFSLTQQAVSLGYSPRVTIVHTSAREQGQIYIPEINTLLAVGCVLVVLYFQSSSNLGAAYGIAVTGTMGITTILFYLLARLRWRWSVWQAGALAGLFLAVDLAFFGANVLKILQGGWVPLVVAGGIFALMTTWKAGREGLSRVMKTGKLPTHILLDDLKRKEPVRVDGTAVFMTSDPDGIPPVLLHHLKHNKVLHQQVVLLSVKGAPVPYVESTRRTHVQELGMGFWRVTARYGFMQTPQVQDIMKSARNSGLVCSNGSTSYYLGRELLLPTGPTHMARWRKRIFILMMRNARSATAFFGIPP